ncbi:glycosyltransferase family 2 protein [Neomicrococcus aestuarii]|uniref:glycosyltransferase family 2 protein n=1 Tax=Neomicrococcus aestuarii TaxID=556325 RepID=UPI001E50270E|nr:glycosyltransferase [Neomicrococcus aestuarii]
MAEVLPEQLEALAGQKNAPEFDVVVSDNGSTDGTRNCADYREWPFKLRFVDSSQKPGASHARNIGAASTGADVLLFCDADDVVDKNWVAELSNAIEASEGSLVAGALVHERFNSKKVLLAYGIPEDPQSLEALPGIDWNPEPFANYLPTVAGGNFAILSSVYSDVGGMNPNFPGGSEETDFSWRVQRSGIKVVSAPKALVQYRLRQDKRGIFRQQRIQQYARVFLWTQYKDTSMSGPSIKYSITEILKTLPRAINPSPAASAQRLRAVRILGGNIGAVQGIAKYRILEPLKNKIRPRN